MERKWVAEEEEAIGRDDVGQEERRGVRLWVLLNGKVTRWRKLKPKKRQRM